MIQHLAQSHAVVRLVSQQKVPFIFSTESDKPRLTLCMWDVRRHDTRRHQEGLLFW